MINIEEKIKNTDWSQYSGPEYYSPEELVEALNHLARHDESKAKH